MTQGEMRARETAMQAERHWWVSKLQALSKEYRRRAMELILIGEREPEFRGSAELRGGAYIAVADDLDALIKERTS